MKVLKMNDHVRFENTLGIMDCDQFAIIVPTERGWDFFSGWIFDRNHLKYLSDNLIDPRCNLELIKSFKKFPPNFKLSKKCHMKMQ